jgi:chromosome segregation ATPase
MKKSLIILLLMMMTIAFIIPQVDEEPAYIDINAAQKKISELEQQNSQLTTERDNFKSDVEQAKSKVTSTQEELTKLLVLMDKIVTEGFYLNQQTRNTIDKEGKKKAQEKYREYREIIRKLQSRQIILENIIEDEQEKAAEAKNQLDTRDYQISVNKQKIVSINKAIEKTKTQIGTIDTHISTFDSLKSEAQSFIQ